MGLQDWLDKAAPAAALLKGGGLAQNDRGSFQQPEGPAISRFTGLPVVPTRLDLSLEATSPATENPLVSAMAPKAIPVETHFSESSDPAPPVTPVTTPPPAFPESFFVDTDDLTDFHPLYPKPDLAQGEDAPTAQQSLQPQSFQHNNTPFLNESPLSTPSLAAEDFYVAPAEAFVIAPTKPEAQQHTQPHPQAYPQPDLQFAWPNNDEDHDNVPFDSPAFGGPTALANEWPSEPAFNDDFFTQPLDSPSQQPSSTFGEDPFGLNDFTQNNALPLPQAALDDFGLEEGLHTWDEASQSNPNNTLLGNDDTPFSSLDAGFSLALDDLNPLYPVDDQSLLQPSFTVEPPDALSEAWSEHQPWAIAHNPEPLFENPLDASPLHLLDTVDTDTFVSDWELTLPNDIDSVAVPFHTAPPYAPTDEYSLESSYNPSFNEDLERDVESGFDAATNLPSEWDPMTLPELPTDSATQWEPSTEQLAIHIAEKGNTDESGGESTFDGLLQETVLSNSPTSWAEDDAWLYETVAENFWTPPSPSVTPASTPPATNDMLINEAPANAPIAETPLPLPLAEAVTKNNRMHVALVPDPSGTGVLLQARSSDLQATETEPPKPYLLKRFAKNPMGSAAPANATYESNRLTLTEEARLKGKTLYRVALGPWRGIFSHSERNGIVFQDEWESD